MGFIFIFFLGGGAGLFHASTDLKSMLKPDII